MLNSLKFSFWQIKQMELILDPSQKNKDFYVKLVPNFLVF